MDDTLGLSFSPFGDNSQKNSQTGATPSPQEAIKILSLHMPRTVGAASPIPGLLMNATGSAGFSGANGPAGAPMDIEALLRRLFGQQGGPGGLEQPSQGPTSPAMGQMAPPFLANIGQSAQPHLSSAPPPRTTPGVENRRPGDVGEAFMQPPPATPSATAPASDNTDLPFFRQPAGPRDRRV